LQAKEKTGLASRRIAGLQMDLRKERKQLQWVSGASDFD